MRCLRLRLLCSVACVVSGTGSSADSLGRVMAKDELWRKAIPQALRLSGVFGRFDEFSWPTAADAASETETETGTRTRTRRDASRDASRDGSRSSNHDPVLAAQMPSGKLSGRPPEVCVEPVEPPYNLTHENRSSSGMGFGDGDAGTSPSTMGLLRFPAAPRCPFLKYGEMGKKYFYDAQIRQCVFLDYSVREDAIFEVCQSGSWREPNEYVCRGLQINGWEVKCRAHVIIPSIHPFYSNVFFQCVRSIFYVPRLKRCPPGFTLKLLNQFQNTIWDDPETICIKDVFEPAELLTTQNGVMTTETCDRWKWDHGETADSFSFGDVSNFGRLNSQLGQKRPSRGGRCVSVGVDKWARCPPDGKVKVVKRETTISVDTDLGGPGGAGGAAGAGIGARKGVVSKPTDSGWWPKKIEKKVEKTSAKKTWSELDVPRHKEIVLSPGIYCKQRIYAAPDPDVTGCQKGYHWSVNYQGCVKLDIYSPPLQCPTKNFRPIAPWGFSRRNKRVPRGDWADQCFVDTAIAENPSCRQGFRLVDKRWPQKKMPFCVKEFHEEPIYACPPGSTIEMVHNTYLCRWLFDQAMYSAGPPYPTWRQKHTTKLLLRNKNVDNSVALLVGSVIEELVQDDVSWPDLVQQEREEAIRSSVKFYLAQLADIQAMRQPNTKPGDGLDLQEIELDEQTPVMPKVSDVPFAGFAWQGNQPNEGTLGL